MACRIVDLTLDAADLVEQAAVLLREAFRNRTRDWQDLDSARQEVLASLAPDRISRLALDASGKVVGWIGGIPTYDGLVWELHPLVVAESHRRRGIGRALVQDLERLVGARGALTLWLGSDDEHDETSVSGVDLYADIPGSIRDLKKLRGEHPFEFYLRLGFRITGVMPDANGRGQPDIFFAKRIELIRKVFTKYEIRRANPSDASDIGLAHLDSIRSVGPNFYPANVVEDWAEGLTPDIYVKAMEGGEVFFVAVGQIGDEPVVLGFATHRVDDARDGMSVYVRGIATRHGIGSALLRSVEAHAIDRGATSIQVEGSLAGVEFYKANGFKEVGRGDTLLMSGRPIACVFMRKTLATA
jgi:aminoglycoside 6'-N-acetyltransferase I